MTITPTPATAPMTTVHGFAIQVLAFIPIPKGDLKKQIDVSQALIDLAEGKKTIAELVPFMKGIEVRQQHVGKRVTVAEATEWNKPKEEPKQEEAPAGDQPETAATAEPETKPKGKGKAKDQPQADLPDVDLSGMDSNEE